MKKTRRKRSVIWLTPSDVFQSIVLSSKTKKEVILKLGLEFSRSHYKTLDARILEENISLSHFSPNDINNLSVKRKPLSEFLIDNSNANGTYLKKRLIEEGVLEEICSICGIGNIWNGKRLILELDHINGKNNDNTLKNLRLLCPNCHSQTDTFSGKNQKNIFKKCISCGLKVDKKSSSSKCRSCFSKGERKVERPDKAVIEKQVSEIGYVGTSKIYGVSDNAIRKWLK